MSSPNGGAGGAGGAGAAGGVTPTSGGPTAGHLPGLLGSIQPPRQGRDGKPLPGAHKPVRKTTARTPQAKGRKPTK